MRKRFGRFLLPVGALLLVGVLCFLHFVLHFHPGNLSVEGMDAVQAARYLAKTGHFGTQIIRPLWANGIDANRDGSMPDLNHQPLYILLSAGVIRTLRHTAVGQGDREAVSVAVLFFGLCIAGCYFLATRLFAREKSPVLAGTALFGCLLFTLATPGLTTALQPSPVTLATFLFIVLLLLFQSLDTPTAWDDMTPRPRPYAGAIIAGLVYGLLFLSIYSALLLLPALLFYLWRISRRELGLPAVFLVAATLMASPWLYRNWHLTHYPLFNGRLLGLLAHTGTYPGYSFYRNSALLLPIPQYLANGGIQEIIRKMLMNLLEFYSKTPAAIGGFLLPLFLGASLTRFTDPRVNRLRSLVYSCFGLHILGFAFFQTVDESLPIFLMYTPFICVLSAAFLLTVVRARNWPVFLAQATIFGWTLMACLPGLVLLLFWPVPPERASIATNVYYHLNTESPEMQVFMRERSALLISDAPWDIAYRCDYPTLWLPNDTGTFQAMEEKFGRPIAGTILTSKVQRDYPDDTDALPYLTLYDRLAVLADIAAKSDRPFRDKIIERERIFYPARISDAMATFQPVPLPEEDGSHFSMLFWNRPALKQLTVAKLLTAPPPK